MAGYDQNFFNGSSAENPFVDSSVREIINSTRDQIDLHHYDPKPIDKNRNNYKVCEETEDLIRKQEALERKEKELAEKEKELKNSSQNIRRSNWPPLPDKCCFQPCFYQDIQVDIPTEFQRIVYNLYYLWILHGILLILNTIGGIILNDFNIIGEGLLYLLVFTPLGYICWFRPAYKAFRSDSSFNFMVFFLMFFFQLIISITHAIGATGCGTIGIVTALIIANQANINLVSKLFVMFVALGFSAAALLDLFLISKIHKIYRSTGASFEKAHQEFTNDFLQNEHVKNVTEEAVRIQLSHLEKNEFK